MSNRVPRIELTRERSSILESIQSFTRAIRGSLRLHSVRREKKRRQKKANKADAKIEAGLLRVGDLKTKRSKSVDYNQNSEFTEEISEVGISAVVLSDIGPQTSQDREHQPLEAQIEEETDSETTSAEPRSELHRRYSKSVDEVEMAVIRKQIETDEPGARHVGRNPPHMSFDICDQPKKKTSRQMSVPVGANEEGRRTSRDDSSITKSDAKRSRSRFAHLLEALRAQKLSLHSLNENNLA